MEFLIVLFPVLAIVTVIVVYKRSQRLPRDAAIRLCGNTVDLSFTAKDNSILERLKFFKIYDASTLQVSAHNVLRSNATPPDVWIFDYHAQLGLRNVTRKLDQTVCYFSDSRMRLPGFRMLPKKTDFAKQSDQVFKYRPIIFQSSPHFMSLYRLIGPDEQEIRELFTTDLIACFEKIRGLCVEGFENEMIIYHYNTVINDRQYLRFYRNAQSIFEHFLDHCTTSHIGKTGSPA